MFRKELETQAAAILERCRAKGLKIATAESCTGGLLAALFTEIPGASDVFDRGMVTYSNTAKADLLGVDASLIATHGAVSSEVAKAMAQGLLNRTGVDIAAAVTGIAGPGSGTKEKPVGLVYVAVATRIKADVAENHFKGGRGDIRMASIDKALAMLTKALK